MVRNYVEAADDPHTAELGAGRLLHSAPDLWSVGFDACDSGERVRPSLGLEERAGFRIKLRTVLRAIVAGASPSCVVAFLCVSPVRGWCFGRRSTSATPDMEPLSFVNGCDSVGIARGYKRALGEVFCQLPHDCPFPHDQNAVARGRKF